MLTIERYARSRFWALYENRQLLCVTVYKKGANAVKERLERGVPFEVAAPSTPAPPSQGASHRRRSRRRAR